MDRSSFVLLWRLGWFRAHLYSWRAYCRATDQISQRRAACCRRALDDGAATIRELLERLDVVARFLAVGRR